MPWELNKVEVQRKDLIDAFLNGDASMTELCKKYKISRKTAYKWLKRYIESRGELSLSDLPKAPKNPHKIFDDDLISIAVDTKLKHRTWGPRKILAKLRREYPEIKWPSGTRLYEIFKSLHLVTPRRIRGRVPATHPLGELNESNDVWMADFKGWFLTGDNKKCEPLTITDGFSRFLIKCEYTPKKSVEYVWPIYREAFLEYGLPNRLRTDNGAPFGSRGAGRLTPLAVNLIKAGVTPEWIHPGQPQENGRHERMHLTLKQSVANPPANNLPEQIRRMKGFQEEYNFDRPHESLEMKTPDCYYSKSIRQWDGILRSPEYDTGKMLVRKVSSGGTIWIKQKEYYISGTISGEYVGIEKEEDKLKIYFGPVFLGRLVIGKGLEKPKLERKPIIRRG
jgi:putative transposase